MIAFCALLVGPAFAQAKMEDPLFGNLYDPAKVSFERAPNLDRQCPDLTGRYLGSWIYGHYKAKSLEYFIISGFMNGEGGVSPDFGIIVELDGTKCDSAHIDYAFASHGPDKLLHKIDDNILSALLDDALLRYVRAFGGKKRFLGSLPKDLSYLDPRLQVKIRRLEQQKWW